MGDDVGLGIVTFRAALKTRVPNADESYFDATADEIDTSYLVPSADINSMADTVIFLKKTHPHRLTHFPC